MKKIITEPPMGPSTSAAPWEQGQWPASWICAPGINSGPVVMLFELTFNSPCTRTVDVHITADERYILSLNGIEEGRGSEPGTLLNWFYDTYNIKLRSGTNTINIMVWAAGKGKHFSKISSGPALLMACFDDALELSTGIAGWKVKELSGYRFIPAKICWGSGSNSLMDGKKLDHDMKRQWQTPEILQRARHAGMTTAWSDGTRLLTPSTLPPMETMEWSRKKVRYARKANSTQTENMPVQALTLDHQAARSWQNMLDGKSAVTVAANSTYEIIIDMEDYVCVFNRIIISRGEGARISADWAEALYEKDDRHSPKGNRNAIEGKFFIGEGDVFIAGGRHCDLEGLWWHAGRYLKLTVETRSEALIFEALELTHTSYPLKIKSHFSFSDENLQKISPLMIRSMQMCSHETFQDCPYYEQLMYVGDSRLENLIYYVLCDDDTLPRKAISMFDLSRRTLGSISSRYPSFSVQHIPGFDLLWIGMVYDFALWRGDKSFVRRMMPGVRGVIDYFMSYMSKDNMLIDPPGWKFMDWVPDWEYGIPPSSNEGISPVLNWLFVYTLTLAAKLENWFDEKIMADLHMDKAKTILKSLQDNYWSDKHNMYADNLEKSLFSEHSQCLAVLSGLLPAELECEIMQNAAKAAYPKQTTVYFSHYWFEALYKIKRADLFFKRLERDWFYLPEMGFKTVCERPLPTRSDCHAWSSHPLYHFFASIMGIRPSGPGLEKVSISPMPGSLSNFSGELSFQGKSISIKQNNLGELFISCDSEACAGTILKKEYEHRSIS